MSTPQEGGGSTPGATPLRTQIIDYLDEYAMECLNDVDRDPGIQADKILARLLALPSIEEQLKNISDRASRYHRGTDEQKYLLMDLEYIEKQCNELRATLRAEIKGEGN